MDRFEPPSPGGRRPVPRYLSRGLLNSIRFDEFQRLRSRFPDVVNGLTSDSLYAVENGSEPANQDAEVLQTWDAITSFASPSTKPTLNQCLGWVEAAGQLYNAINASPAEVYRTLIEATAFGARMILERLCKHGVEVHRIVCAGGIAEKNPLLMQIYADVTGREMRVARSSQACALGAAMAASVVAGHAAGGHADFASAQRAMTGLKPVIYRPDAEAVAVYNRLFDLYRRLHDAFGGVNCSAHLGPIMKGLLSIKADSRG